MSGGAIEDYVAVDITINSPTVTQEGFGLGLFAGDTAGWITNNNGDLIRYYNNYVGVAADFAPGTPELKAAAAAFAASPTPPKIAIGKVPASVAGVMTITFGADLIAANSFIATVQGIVLAATVYAVSNAATLTAICAKIAAIAGVTSAVSDGSHVITVTFDFGTAPSIAAAAVTLGVTQASTTVATFAAAVLLSTGLTAIRAVDKGWYGLTTYSQEAGDLIDVSDWAETNMVRHVGQTADAAVLTSAVTDVGSKAQTKSYNQTTIFYHAIATEQAAFEWLCQELCELPGSATWMFKTLPTITVDPLTPTQMGYCRAKNVAVYTAETGVNMTEQGKTAGGQFIDIMFGRDWLRSTMKTDVFALLTTAKKIPYTDAGAAQVESIVRARLKIGINNGFIADDKSVKVFVPKVTDQAVLDRAARYFPGMTFSGNLAGAMHKIGMAGTLSV